MLIFMTVAVGYAEKLGLFDALMRKAVIGAPIMIVFIAVSFVGVNSSIGFGAGVVSVSYTHLAPAYHQGYQQL